MSQQSLQQNKLYIESKDKLNGISAFYCSPNGCSEHCIILFLLHKTQCGTNSLLHTQFWCMGLYTCPKASVNCLCQEIKIALITYSCMHVIQNLNYLKNYVQYSFSMQCI